MKLYRVKVRTSSGTIGPFRMHAKDVGHCRRMAEIEYGTARKGHGKAERIEIQEIEKAVAA